MLLHVHYFLGIHNFEIRKIKKKKYLRTCADSSLSHISDPFLDDATQLFLNVAYNSYPKYSDTLSPNFTCPNIWSSKFYYLYCLKK